MDPRLIAVVEQLSQDMARVAEAMTHSQCVLDKLLQEMHKNGKTVERRLDTIQATQRFLVGLLQEMHKNDKTVERRLDTIQATQRFLAGQQPRRGAIAQRMENDGHD